MFPGLQLPELALSFPHGGMDIAFYAVAIVMLVTAVFTVAVKNILQSAVFLIFSFVTTAILYLLLHAEFIALAQVMVYIGGVGSITGSIVGTVLLCALPELLRAVGDWRLVFYGLAVIVIMIVRPQGLLGGKELRLGRFIAKLFSKKEAGKEVA